MSCAAYLPFPLLPLRGTVRAFDHRSRLGLSVSPPFGHWVEDLHLLAVAHARHTKEAGAHVLRAGVGEKVQYS
jgi:hypothetical protein